MSPEPRTGGGPPPPGIPPYGALLVAVVAVSWAGPLIRFSVAPALAISAWRLVFSVAFIAVVLVVRREVAAVARLGAGEWALAAVSGVLLAGHFWSWIASIKLTTIASSVVLVSTQPIFAAVFSVAFLDERPTRRQWWGIVVAVGGAAVIGWGDFAAGGTAFVGDLLATGAAALAAGYYVIGRRLRRELDLWVYVGVVYGVAAVVLMAGVVAMPSVPTVGYEPVDWLVFLGLAAGPMMLGHTGVNYALRYVPAYVANLVLLGEPVGATLLAWLLPAIAEQPPTQTLVGGALILGGIALGVERRRRSGSPGGGASGGRRSGGG